MKIRLLSKLSQPVDAKDKNPHVFADYHTGEVFHYHKNDGSLPCRTAVGGDILDTLTTPGWIQPT
jgi:hypothetical protein